MEAEATMEEFDRIQELCCAHRTTCRLKQLTLAAGLQTAAALLCCHCWSYFLMTKLHGAPAQLLLCWSSLLYRPLCLTFKDLVRGCRVCSRATKGLGARPMSCGDKAGSQLYAPWRVTEEVGWCEEKGRMDSSHTVQDERKTTKCPLPIE